MTTHILYFNSPFNLQAIHSKLKTSIGVPFLRHFYKSLFCAQQLKRIAIRLCLTSEKLQSIPANMNKTKVYFKHIQLFSPFEMDGTSCIEQNGNKMYHYLGYYFQLT